MKITPAPGRLVLFAAAVAMFLAFFPRTSASREQGERATAPGEWPMFNRDLAGTRFSPLTEINTDNVANLQLAWRMRLRAESTPTAGRGRGGGGAGGTQATPIVVDGIMYTPGPNNRVLALDPTTGEELWGYTVIGGSPSRRGVAYWPGDANNPARIFFTAGQRLIGLDAASGDLVSDIDMVIPYSSVPTIYEDLLIVGANVPERQSPNQPGNTRAFDAITGEKVWEFHSVPQPGEIGNDTWADDSWRDRTGVNNWGFYMTVDAERGILYTVFGSPASDYYGGDREGDNLFGNSVVALEAGTGELLWYFQTVHHDQWDFDLPPAPVLLDVMVDGEMTPILAQTGKVGYMYILNRVTGEPIFGIEETPVPISQVPGEHSSPTQPIPVKPKPFGRMSFTMDDLVTAADTTEEHAQACRELVEQSGGLYNEGPFTPWAYRAPGAPPVSSVIFPGAIGGTDWGGVSADPGLGYIFVTSSNYGSIGWVTRNEAGYSMGSVYGNPVASKFWDRKTDENGQLLGESSWPCQKPPWGLLTAVDASTGEFAWQVPLGITEELPLEKQRTGRVTLGGSIATAGGLIFVGASNDRRFRAFDSKTGEELWVTRLDYSALSVPMTYEGRDGKQYVAVTAAGGGAITSPNPANSESLYVFALP